ncbi:MAG: (d)CMP kinase [Flavicella sp.]
MTAKKHITIAIDGYSSTGKSTIAKQLANQLGYIYVDSGAMYRMVTLYAIQRGFIGDGFFEVEKLISELDQIQLGFIFNESEGFAEAYLNDVNVEARIRTMEVSDFVSPIATVSEVRRKLVEMQQQMGKDQGVVMDGRDIGTVVFPEAELKLFMTASAETRAKRRYKQSLAKGEKVLYEAVLENVTSRDRQDTSREDSPLVKASDAIEIDNSDLTREAQFLKIMALVKQCLDA